MRNLSTSRIVTRFTTRNGGNLGLHVGDDPQRVIENREGIATELGVPLDAWVAGNQVHGSTVTVVTAKEKGRGARAQEDLLPDTDALITDVPGVALSTYAADCVPILFADDKRGAVGAAHAGWKGTVAKIAAKTVVAMKEEYGCDPAQLVVRIGPSIGPCCYEVDGAVVQGVRENFGELADLLLTPNENGRWQFDLWKANEQALLEVGVLPMHILREDRCTSCGVETYFSYRKEQGKTGRHAGVIVLLQEIEGS
ncbi:hypothetical protein CIG75_13200 [Tumebacillus algifaecis]|uniref:Purine nucleoside phosphorylase n=1 Tax=Tumebacillus algifaecis TaxID=1214604 RepID=A0A223D2K4_9BACL|nr:peptidoglycan editing factor PgeF [Tumebacillus algifaecis]ASS75842.1 hypothetical protein CIG75_13200 [Tumebacillus algifaecis]